jgi:hypothetical protein
MPGLVPGIHVFLLALLNRLKTWMAGKSIVSSTHRLRLWRDRHVSRENIRACKKSSQIINLKN